MEAQQQAQQPPPQEQQARKRPDKSRGHRPRAVYTCDACRLRKVKCDGCDGGPGCSHCRRRGESCTWTKGKPRSGPVRGVYVQGYGYGYGNGHGRGHEQGQEQGYRQGLEDVGTGTDSRDTSLSSRLARIETLLSEAGWRVSSEQGSRRGADAGTRPTRAPTTTTMTTAATSTVPQPARPSSVEGDSEAVDDLLATAEHRQGRMHADGHRQGHRHGHGHERRRDEPDQVYIARHDRFDHQILVSSPDAHPGGGAGAGSSSMASSPVFGSGSEGAARGAAGLDDAFGARAHVFRSRLPARPTCDAVVRLYFARLEWIHHVIHVPSFLAWYEGLWARHDLGRDDLLMLALLYALLCVTGHFFDLKPGHVHTDDDEQHHPPPFEDHDMYRLSYECLVEAEYLRRHSLTAIQTLVMQGLYLVNMGENDTHHANLALAIRMAAALGLSKLDAPGPGGGAGTSNAHASASAGARLRAEMGRRVWWSMVCQDAYTASSCNFSYSIVDGQVKTHLPANLDDEQLLVLSAHARPLPLDSHATSMSYHIAKIPFALIAKKTVDLFNDDRLDYGAVLALEDELQAQYRALPAYLRPEAADEEGRDEAVTRHGNGNGNGEHDDDDGDDDGRQQQLRWQRLFMGITLHNRIMRIYRPMLGHAYNNDDDGGRQRAAKRALVTSAKALMRLVARARQIGFPGLRWWVVLVHVFTAAVVLCVHVHFAAAAAAAAAAGNAGLAGVKKEEDEAESVALLRVAVEVLGAAAKRSAAARQAVRLVEMLQMRSRSQLQSSHGARTTRPGETARQHHGYGNDGDGNNSGPSRGQDASTLWQHPQQQQVGQPAMSPWHASRAMAPAPSNGNNGAGGDNDDDDARGWMDLDWSSLLGHAPRPGPVPVADSQASSSSSSSADPALLGSGISGLNQDLWETIEAFATSSSSLGIAAPAALGTAAFVPTAFGGF
ncbi:hypothetical protein FA10DRAFT_303681 [Acaromyces ingoldii]|uniref:Zn(2)-C6 fungal-type domain-containing protein n=1 Tax=Acaromyces ingoldii TaxID=215250 RepID=A0A316YHV6_9BASI|nr:hypothetical protein FA10DRAFT_303681 [Acaromyces ingoldii]PWN88752.1 hypothetical protein FA10DRAFT_303681 [Acaromyces ingoldii]